MISGSSFVSRRGRAVESGELSREEAERKLIAIVSVVFAGLIVKFSPVVTALLGLLLGVATVMVAENPTC